MTQMHLFVCSGNTCRSQMAQALAEYYFPHYGFASAGLAAVPGTPTSDHARAILRAQEAIIWQGTSQPVTRQLILQYDCVWPMTQAHASQLRQLLIPGSGHSPQIECLAAEDIADPYGCDRAFYASCFKVIRAAVLARFGTDTSH